MALSVVLRAAGANTAASPNTTASFTPTTGRVLIAIVEQSGVTTPGTVSGLSGTWIHIGHAAFGSNNNYLSAFYCTNYTGTGTLTVTNPTGSTHAVWSVFEVNGANTTNPIQTDSFRGTSLASTSTPSLTLPAASYSANRPFAAFGCSSQITATPRTNWTEISDGNIDTPSGAMEVQWRSDTAETTASATWTSAAVSGVIGFLVNEAAAPTPTEPNFKANDTGAVVTESFTPPDNSLLVALCTGTDGGLGTITDSLGGSWTRVARCESTDQSASSQAEIFIRDVSTGASMTVTYDNTRDFACMKVMALTGMKPVSGQTATAVTSQNVTTLALSVTTTVVDSLVVIASSFWLENVASTPNANTTELGQYGASNEACGFVGRATNLTTTPGSTSFGWTETTASATCGNAAIEILPVDPPVAATHQFFAFF